MNLAEYLLLVTLVMNCCLFCTFTFIMKKMNIVRVPIENIESHLFGRTALTKYDKKPFVLIKNNQYHYMTDVILINMLVGCMIILIFVVTINLL